MRCEKYYKKHDYNIVITNMKTKEKTQVGSYPKIGYGIAQFEGGLKRGVVYKIMIYDFVGKTGHDFTVTVYSENAKVYLHNT